MVFVMETVSQLFVWLRGELVISAALLPLLLGPGAVCCWLGYHISGVRLVAAGDAAPKLATRRPRTDRIEQRLTTLSTAISLLADSTESGLREALKGLERLSAAAPADPIGDRGMPQRMFTAAGHGQTPREMAIAAGISEGEARLRLRLQGVDLAHTGISV